MRFQNGELDLIHAFQTMMFPGRRQDIILIDARRSHPLLHGFPILHNQNRTTIHQVIEARNAISQHRQHDVKPYQGDDDEKGIGQGVIILIQSALNGFTDNQEQDKIKTRRFRQAAFAGNSKNQPDKKISNRAAYNAIHIRHATSGIDKLLKGVALFAIHKNLSFHTADLLRLQPKLDGHRFTGVGRRKPKESLVPMGA